MTRLLVACAFVVATAGANRGNDAPKLAAEAFTGKVVPISTLKTKPPGKFAADAVALVTDDGKVYPIETSDAAKKLVLDKGLHDRPMKLTATLTAANALKVTKVQSVVKGKVHDIDYWCENCQFANTAPGPCMCCGGPTEFRERPAK